VPEISNLGDEVKEEEEEEVVQDQIRSDSPVELPKDDEDIIHESPYPEKEEDIQPSGSQ